MALDLKRATEFCFRIDSTSAEQADIQTALYAEKCGFELGVADLTRSKAAFDGAYRASYAGFDFLVVEFDSVLPVVSCGAFFPKFDFFG